MEEGLDVCKDKHDCPRYDKRYDICLAYDKDVEESTRDYFKERCDNLHTKRIVTYRSDHILFKFLDVIFARKKEKYNFLFDENGLDVEKLGSFLLEFQKKENFSLYEEVLNDSLQDTVIESRFWLDLNKLINFGWLKYDEETKRADIGDSRRDADIFIIGCGEDSREWGRIYRNLLYGK